MMFDRARPGLRVTAVVIAFVLLGFAQASGANDADDHSDNSVAIVGLATPNDADFSAATRTDLEPMIDVHSDDSDVIEEIVVIGVKKTRRSKLERGQSTDPVIKGPSRLDWRFFPVYDPERAALAISYYPIDDQIRRAGHIEIFRLRFGR